MMTECTGTANGRLLGKRVIFVFSNLDLGGAERQGLLLARHLRDVTQADAQVWGFEGPGRVAELCKAYGIPWRVFPFRWNVGPLQLVREHLNFCLHLRKIRADVLLPYYMPPNLACCSVWKWTGARVCIWQQRDEGMSRGRRWLERWAVNAAPTFVANSQPGFDFLLNTLGAAPGKIHFIRNGVALAPPVNDRVTWRNRLELDQDVLSVCMVANLHSYKDHETLLRAWRIVVERWQENRRLPRLLLAGRFGNTAQQSKARAAELGLGGTVRFLGPVKDMAGLLAAVDLGVFSSRLEGCPNGVLECMASGLAIAGTDIPGIRDAVGEEGVEFLAPVGDSVTLAKRILRLLSDQDLRKQVGSLNRQRAEYDFSPAGMCEATVEVILQGLH